MSTFPLNSSPSPFLRARFDDKRTAVLKHIARSERLVAVRPASRLEVRPRPEMLSTGIPELNAIAGGIPRGCLTEICGSASSGKTSVLLATIAAATQKEEACVLIDASDSFDPISGAAAGVDFSKLLWIRCGFPLCNPVSSGVSGFDHKGHPSTSLRASSVTQSQGKNSERNLEQVLKATDLILQSGGFGLVALDLAGIPEKFVRRISLASWFRFQRTVEHSKTALLVLSEFPCAQTCAALAMKLSNKRSAVSHSLSGKLTHAEIMHGMQVETEILRTRLERKPMQSIVAVFRTQAVRTG